MTQYTATCTHDEDDRVTVNPSDKEVCIKAHTWNGPAASVYLTPDNARTFARGILAVADEADGKRTDREPLPVGTRVRVLEAYGIPDAAGKLATVRAETDQPGRLKVRLDTPWCAASWADKIYADRWEVVDETSAVEPAVKIGDRVRVLRPETCYQETHTGSLGTLTDIDNSDCRYRVRADDEDIVWAYEVERVDDAPAEEPVADFAKRLEALRVAREFAGPEADAFDVLEYARYLLGEDA